MNLDPSQMWAWRPSTVADLCLPKCWSPCETLSLETTIGHVLTVLTYYFEILQTPDFMEINILYRGSDENGGARLFEAVFV